MCVPSNLLQELRVTSVVCRTRGSTISLDALIPYIIRVCMRERKREEGREGGRSNIGLGNASSTHLLLEKVLVVNGSVESRTVVYFFSHIVLWVKLLGVKVHFLTNQSRMLTALGSPKASESSPVGKVTDVAGSATRLPDPTALEVSIYGTWGIMWSP